jgi:CelD/BcsL family acetyltransferase involved in cellulose biosynthesis
LTVDELDAPLIGAWRSIQARHDIFASPYFCPEFVQAVASVRRDVRVVVIENGGRPAGFFPHQRAAWGRGRPVGGPLSDYHGVIAERGSDWSVPGLMRAAGLAAWSFDHLVDDSDRFAAYVTAHAESPQMDMSEGFEHYLRQLGDPPSDAARKARKLAREAGELSFSLHEPQGAALDWLLERKREQYRRTGLADVFGVAWTGALLRRIMALQSEGFAGVCSVLRAGGRIVAAHAGMRSRDMLHWWFPSYAGQYAAYSPGILLILRIAQAAAGAGIRTIDLGKGDSRYKRSLMNRVAELREGRAEVPSLLGNARRLLPPRLVRRLERALRFA